MKEARYSLTQEQLNDLAAIAADRAVEAYRSEEQKTQKRKDNENVRITKKKLQSYRRVKASLAETEEFTEDEKIELRWAFVRDLMGSGLDVVEKADNRIRSVENKRKKTHSRYSLSTRLWHCIRKRLTIPQARRRREDTENCTQCILMTRHTM